MSELPKSVRDRLRGSDTPVVHPDADQLTAFGEGLLGGSEREQVMAHLSACSECREVAFLAGEAVEQPAEQKVVDARPKRAWRWMVPVATAAALAVSFGIYFEIGRSPQAIQVERKPVETAKATPPVQDVAPQETPAPESYAKAPAKHVAAKKESKERNEQSLVARSDSRIVGGIVSSAPSGISPAPVATPPPPRATPPSTEQTVEVSAAQAVINVAPSELPKDMATSGGAQKAAPTAQARATEKLVPLKPNAATTQSPQVEAAQAAKVAPRRTMQEAAGYTGNAELADRGRVSPPQKMAKAVALRASWRITDVGSLERSFVSGEWQPMLPNAKTEIRTVAVVGQHVWAGGANGTLFHTTDDGNHWQEVGLVSAGKRVSAAINSIHFDDEKNGTVTTATGERWITSDEGNSWKKQ